MSDALVLPGGLFGPAAGVLLYASLVPARRGSTVHRHTWTSPPPDPADASAQAWVHAEVAPVLDGLRANPLVVGKSLGSLAAGLVAERSLTAVWLTPLLVLPSVVESLSRAEAPFLLVGGTGDDTWDSETAHRLSPHVVEIPDADHGLTVPGPLSATISVLATVITRIDDFLADVGWPS